MFYIVEEESKLLSLEKLVKLGVYVDVIPTSNLYHPKLTSIVAVYIRLIGSEHGYIIPIDHDEGLNTTRERISRILSKATKLYTLDKKNLLYYFNIQGAIDLSLLYSMTKYQKLEYTRENNFTNNIYNKFSDLKFINKLIPILNYTKGVKKFTNRLKK